MFILILIYNLCVCKEVEAALREGTTAQRIVWKYLLLVSTIIVFTCNRYI